PGGLTLSDSGLISGTPTASGTASFTIRFTDAGQRTVTRAYTLTVNPQLSITTTSPLPDTLNGSVLANLAAAGGAPPYRWTVSGGTLPAGVTLSGAGLLSGVTTSEGSFTFQVTVTDTAGSRASRGFTIKVAPQIAISIPQALPDAAINQPYSTTLT